MIDGGEHGDVCILAVGKLVEAAERAAAMLRDEKGLAVTVWDVRCVKPLDPRMVSDAAGHQVVITAEDGVREGGAGSMMADAIAHVHGIGHPGPPVVVFGTPIEFIAQGKPNQILANLGLDAIGIATTAAQAHKAATDAASLGAAR